MMVPLLFSLLSTNSQSKPCALPASLLGAWERGLWSLTCRWWLTSRHTQTLKSLHFKDGNLTMDNPSIGRWEDQDSHPKVMWNVIAELPSLCEAASPSVFLWLFPSRETCLVPLLWFKGRHWAFLPPILQPVSNVSIYIWSVDDFSPQ